MQYPCWANKGYQSKKSDFFICQSSSVKSESLHAISDLNTFYTHLVIEYYTQFPVLFAIKILVEYTTWVKGSFILFLPLA